MVCEATPFPEHRILMKNTKSSMTNYTPVSVLPWHRAICARVATVWQAQLAVVPVQEKERERAHNQEKQDPHPEASIVFDCLEKERVCKLFKWLDFLTSTEWKTLVEWMESSSPLSEHYLSDILVALFDVFCGAYNQLMNTVYLRVLLQQWDGRLTALSTKKTKRAHLVTH